MKTSLKILLLCFIGLYHAKGQYVSMPYSVPTPYGNVTMTQHIYMPTHYYNSNSNPKFKFVVVLKNDSVIELKSRMLSEDITMYVLYNENKSKRKIFPDETKVIFSNSISGRIKGLPADSCWLFKVKKGAINCYSSVPMIDINSTIAIQEGDTGKIVALTKENLQGITGNDDEKIVRWLDKNKLIKVIEYYNEKN